MGSYDFGGWATVYDVRCTDGRTILQNAFAGDNGRKVPIVWNHQHDQPANILGHGVLENRKEGVYVKGYLNDTENGKLAKKFIEKGDITSLSIYANQLKEQSGLVQHGIIREVSLVLAGANSEAYIDTVSISHGSSTDVEAVIFTGETFDYIQHSDEKEETSDSNTDTDIKENSDTVVEDETESEIVEENKVMHSADEKVEEVTMAEEAKATEKGKTIGEVFDTLNEEQKDLVYALIAAVNAVEEETNKKDDEEETNKKDDEGEKQMKHNVFEGKVEDNDNVISHSTMMAALSDAKRLGSLKEAALEHGITDIQLLFPEEKAVGGAAPQWLKRDTGWVSKVMGAVSHTPFSRIKSVFANITEEEARAKGYVKGKIKKEEVFSLLKRTTTPQTIYKKQKLDRDDMLDITDFDVVAWIKSEMRMMLDEEIARAVLIGDGRLTSSDDKIQEVNVRPVANDAELYTIKASVSTGANPVEQTNNFVEAAIRARASYQGSGNPTLYTTEQVLTDMLLLKDNTGRYLYEDETKLAKLLRVKEIVTVEPMTNHKNEDGETLMGVVVNLQDYNIGADKGGQVNMFDDFDIDYNAQKYLIETRISGALIRPYSAIALWLETPAG